jgi:hypothetical protein
MGGFRAWLRRLRRGSGRPRRSLVVPLLGRPEDQANPRRVWAQVPLWVEDRRGDLRQVAFRVDSGASASVIGIDRAQSMDPVVPSSAEQTAARQVAIGRVEVRLRLGALRVRLAPDVTEEPFVWPFEFWRDRPLNRPPLLGLDSIVFGCRWVFDGTPRDAGQSPFGQLLTQDAPYGTFQLDDIR